MRALQACTDWPGLLCCSCLQSITWDYLGMMEEKMETTLVV